MLSIIVVLKLTGPGFGDDADLFIITEVEIIIFLLHTSNTY